MLSPKSFNMKDTTYANMPNEHDPNKHYGLIAQDIESVLSTLGKTLQRILLLLNHEGVDDMPNVC